MLYDRAGYVAVEIDRAGYVTVEEDRISIHHLRQRLDRHLEIVKIWLNDLLYPGHPWMF